MKPTVLTVGFYTYVSDFVSPERFTEAYLVN